jgi:hypothetical protein
MVLRSNRAQLTGILQKIVQISMYLAANAGNQIGQGRHFQHYPHILKNENGDHHQGDQ